MKDILSIYICIDIPVIPLHASHNNPNCLTVNTETSTWSRYCGSGRPTDVTEDIQGSNPESFSWDLVKLSP